MKLEKLLLVFSLSIFFSCSNKKSEPKIEDQQAIPDTVSTDSSQEGDMISKKVMSYYTIENDSSEDDEYHPSNINLFYARFTDRENFAFVSLSDIYHLSEHPDSIAIPNIEDKGFDNAQYLILESRYRSLFLSGTGVQETDSLYMYDCKNNNLNTFAVKDLKVVAQVNPYASSSDWPLSQSDYMIGFEIDLKSVENFEDVMYENLVYIGKENPFVCEQLAPIRWSKIQTDRYPTKTIKKSHTYYLEDHIIGDTYLFEKDNLQYFIQNYHTNEERSYYETYRRLLVVDRTTKDVLADKLFGRGEGTSPSPLNFQGEEDTNIYQWTGKLFKYKAPVTFGFEYISFGCPSISVLDKSGEDIYINCDNRH